MALIKFLSAWEFLLRQVPQAQCCGLVCYCMNDGSISAIEVHGSVMVP